MNAKHVLSLMLAFAMIASIFVPAVSAADSDSKGIDLNASIKEPRPEIGITVDTEAIDFGELLPGETSSSHPVAVTNVGLKDVDVNVEAADDAGQEAVFAPGLLIDGAAWGDYSTVLVSDAQDDLDVALHVPSDVTTRGAIGGSLTVWAEEHVVPAPASDFTYDDDGTSITITKYIGQGGKVVIPSEIDGKSVTTIGLNAFRGCTNLTSAIIPNSVTSIAKSAFYGCTALESVTIPNSVAKLGDYSFNGCIALTAITIPNSVTNIGHSAFAGCVALASAAIPDSVTEIGLWVFEDCTALESVSIGSGVKIIGDSTFKGCTALTSVSIGSGVTTIDLYAFSGCTALTAVIIPSSVNAIRAYAFSGCTALTSMTFEGNAPTTVGANWAQGCTNLIVYYNENATGFTTPTWNGVPSVPPAAPIAAFTTNVTSGYVPLTVQFTDASTGQIDEWVWNFGDGATSTDRNPSHTYESAGVHTVTLTVSNSAGGSSQATQTITVNPSTPDFNYIISDGSIVITGYKGPGGDVVIPGEIDGLPVTVIGRSAFEDRTALTSVTIPNSVSSIWPYAFYGCTALTSVSFGNGVTSVGQWAFQDCSALIAAAIPDSVTEIGYWAFSGCIALTSVSFGSGVADIGYWVFEDCAALTAIDVDADNANYKSVDGVVYTKDGSTAVLCPEGKAGPLAILDGVTSIARNAFYQCTALTSIAIPNGVNDIGLMAFSHTSLTSIVIPDSVTEIGSWAFSGCTALESVTIGSGVDSSMSDAFEGCTALTAINVDPNNPKYKSIDGVVYNKAGTTLLLCPEGIVSLVIPGGVTAIGNSAFYGCAALTSVTIPDSVTAIGDSAFYGCTALASMTFEGNAPTTVGTNWASGSDNLVVYYNENATGFTTPTWNGVPSVPLAAGEE